MSECRGHNRVYLFEHATRSGPGLPTTLALPPRPDQSRLLAALHLRIHHGCTHLHWHGSVLFIYKSPLDSPNQIAQNFLICFLLQVQPIQYSCASLTVFLSWFNLLLLLQRFDQVGIYVVMFLEILQTLIKVLLVFSILIIAFGLAFYILLSDVSIFLINISRAYVRDNVLRNLNNGRLTIASIILPTIYINTNYNLSYL